MSKSPFDLAMLRQRLAQHGIHPAREPREFQNSAEIVGLTPVGVGYDRCAVILAKLRHEAAAATNGNFALAVTRERTGERRGYAIYMDDQTTADRIAAVIREFVR